MKSITIKRQFSLFAIVILFFITMPVLADSLDGKEAIRTIKKLLVSIRLNKNDKALTYMNLDVMRRYLLGPYHSKMKPEQQKHFESSLGKFMQLKAFAWARKNIGSVGLSYDKPVIKNKRVHVRSSLVYAGAERIKFTWILGKFDGKYMVTDVLNIKGQSSLKESRDRQIMPVYKKRGAQGLLKAMDSVIKKLQNK